MHHDADLERRFGGLRRLYGDAAYARLRAARVAIVGVGGVGSWAAEALARCGIAQLTLVDLDHVAESNINRQIQALSTTIGQAKVDALRERIALIHPGCTVQAVDAFVERVEARAGAGGAAGASGTAQPAGEADALVAASTAPPAAPASNWPALLPGPVDVVIDACDDAQAKLILARWALRGGTPLILCGAAGGKRDASRIQALDLVQASNDPLLARLRSQLRREGLLPKAADRAGKPRPPKASGLVCVVSPEPVTRPQANDACALDGSLNCHGYGSVVTVTATMGLVAADAALHCIVSGRRPGRGRPAGAAEPFHADPRRSGPI